MKECRKQSKSITISIINQNFNKCSHYLFKQINQFFEYFEHLLTFLTSFVSKDRIYDE